MKNFIAIEGLDGAGKSTLLNAFSKVAPHFLQMYSVPDELSAIRKTVDKTTDPLAALHFFGLCNLLRSHEITEQVSKKVSVVMDRYIFSTLAYQYLMIGEDIMKYFDIMMKDKKIIMPDLVIFVIAHPEIILKRIQKRDKKLENTRKTEWYGDEISKNKGQELKNAYMKFFEMSKVNFIEFDTSDIKENEMEKRLINLIS